MMMDAETRKRIRLLQVALRAARKRNDDGPFSVSQCNLSVLLGTIRRQQDEIARLRKFIEWIRDVRKWAASFPQTGQPVDDSRESICE